jgi:photosystem II stability/assembly factor-like uncharacterized protein
MKKRVTTNIFSSAVLLGLSLFMLLSLSAIGQTTEPLNWKYKGTAANFYDVQENFNQFWQGKEASKGQGYKIFKRWENFVEPRVYPSGDLSLISTTYPNFMAWQEQRGQNKTASGNFSSLGTNQVASGYDAGAGRINFIRFEPGNTSTMFVSTPDGGLWKSTDGGTTWSTNTDFLPVIGCTDLAINPSNTQVMYLATGDKEEDRRSIGILKSTNGGSTWNPTSLVWTALDNYRTTRLLMDPTDPNIMMVATDGGIFRTTDGWATNSQVDFTALEDMEFKPGDPSIVYAAGKEFLKSTDNGSTWTAITSGLPNPADVSRIVLAVTPASAGNVYAVIGDASDGFLGLYRSTNSGNSFTQQSSSPNILHASAAPGPGDTGGQAFHDLAIAVSPTDADFITVGGINIWQSTDAGVNWARKSYWLGYNAAYPGMEDEPEPYLHADVQYIEYLPGSSTTMFASCDGGISKSTNSGTDWSDITNNLTIGQQTNIALSATNADLMFTGLQDIGTLKRTASGWSVIGGGDGEDGFIDRTNDMNMVYSTTNASFYLSTDGGSTYNDVTGLPSGEWFSPIHQDPTLATTVYAGGFPELYRSLDLFTSPVYTWSQLGSPSGAGNILRFAIAPSNNTIIYAIKEDAISKSTDAGLNWTDVTGALPTGTVALKNLCVSDADPDKVWVVFSGYDAANKVFKSIDGGSTWTNESAGLPNLPINTIVFNNGNLNDAVYIGADIGIYYLDNTLTTWEPFFTGLPNCAVTDLEIFYPTGKLRVATYGRGSWESDLFSPSTGITELSKNGIKIYPNPVTDQLTLEMEGNRENKNFEILNQNGQVVHRGKFVDKVVIETSQFASGVYLIRINAKDAVRFEKLVKQ